MKTAVENEVKNEEIVESPFFNSTGAVELKVRRPISDDLYKKRWMFFCKVLRESLNKGDVDTE